MALEQSLTQVVILTHDNADFDALASLVAAARLYPAATAVLPGRLNRNVRQFLSLYADALPVVEARALPRQSVAKAIIVDTQSASPARGMGSDTRIHIIDHHPRPANLPPNVEFEGDLVGATSTLLVERLRALGMTLPPLEASLLLLGIYEDTGSLTYEGTTPRDLEAARWLLELGGKLDIVQRFLRAPLSAEQQTLFERLINESEVVRIQERSILMATLRLDHFVEELSALAQRLTDLFEPDACFLLAEHAGDVQVIARSATDAVDVGAIARQLHGGGHAKAAAAHTIAEPDHRRGERAHAAIWPRRVSRRRGRAAGRYPDPYRDRPCAASRPGSSARARVYAHGGGERDPQRSHQQSAADHDGLCARPGARGGGGPRAGHRHQD